jgi:hypothetical protein
MTFSEVVELLSDMGYEHFELESDSGHGRVLCAPSLVGRVMTTTFDSADGQSLGRIGIEGICKGPVDPVFNDFGGEERFWLGPEGGQFGLHFSSTNQTLATYRVQAGMSSKPYFVVRAGHGFITMRSRFDLTNCLGTQFEVDILRSIKILDSCPYILDHPGHVDFVGFQTETTITNVGKKPMSWDTGVLSAWTIGQHPSGPRCVVVLPLVIGTELALGKPIREDYIEVLNPGGSLGPGKLSINVGYALLKTESNCSIKIGIGKKRAKNRFGSIDLDRCQMTINDFDLFPEIDYVAPYWRPLSYDELRDGEAISIYVDGSGEAEPTGHFYELESLSPALTLVPTQSHTHRNRIYHIRSDRPVLGSICAEFLGASLDRIDQFADCQESTRI